MIDREANGIFCDDCDRLLETKFCIINSIMNEQYCRSCALKRAEDMLYDNKDVSLDLYSVQAEMTDIA